MSNHENTSTAPAQAATYAPGLSSFYSRARSARLRAALQTARTPAVEDTSFTEDTVAAWCGPAEWSANMYGDYTGGVR